MTFYKNCLKIYSYIKRRRNIDMVDDLPPTKGEVRQTALSLGFEVKTTSSVNFGETQKALVLDLGCRQSKWKC